MALTAAPPDTPLISPPVKSCGVGVPRGPAVLVMRAALRQKTQVMLLAAGVRVRGRVEVAATRSSGPWSHPGGGGLLLFETPRSLSSE